MTIRTFHRLALLAPLVWLAFTAAAQDSALPAGAGKQTVEKVCSGCHEIETAISARRTKAGWETMVDDMASRGANGTPDELAAVVDYLTRFFGKVNVNTAQAKELQSFLGLDEKEAQAIVDYRTKNGRLKDLEQLKNIPGVSADKIQEKKLLVAFAD